MMISGNPRNNNNSESRIRYPFTATQRQELEQQALVFKYMVSGMPVPPDLLFTIRRSFHSSLSSKLLLPNFGWNSFSVGFGRKVDPEPGRCRRTDGKKWRCSKEAHPESKYCQRHMHRGRNRSRKPVETYNDNNNHSNNNNNHSPATTNPAGTNILNTNMPSHSFLYPHHDHHTSQSQQIAGFNFLNPTGTDCSVYGEDCNYAVSLGSFDDGEQKQEQHQQQKKKVMHHFLDEWSSAKGEDSTNWANNNTEDRTTTNLLHDFFMTPKW
ncbi:Growth-regulating factor 5 [Striga hermonthica]|uniref:Growth-regulating factor n=1 Tax=Striga hermonthica TaxID=68872 RepID=A0A9N7R6S1_STRHE|nr:Growth-regulating factor 5 [Striga hermonthica]